MVMVGIVNVEEQNVRHRHGCTREGFVGRPLYVFFCAMSLGACSGPVYVHNYKLAVDAEIDGEAIVFLLPDWSALTVPIMDPDPRPRGMEHPWGYGTDYGMGILFREYG